MQLLLALISLIALTILTLPSPIRAQTDIPWSMAGANPQRTSWTQANVPLNLKTKWVARFSPYIPQKAQVVAAQGKIFISTAKGLYALDATTGTEVWTYATEMPLLHAPAYANGALYVGGFDRKLHAINAQNGAPKWTFTAGGGFDVNPLVVNGVVYAGNRDGHFYALDADTGTLKWKFEVGSQILHSAAYGDSKIFFGAMDSHLYALNTNGSPAWVSAKLPGMGFRSWWPVIYRNNNKTYVIATRTLIEKGLRDIENNWIFANSSTSGNLPGSTLPQNQWLQNHPTINIATNPHGATIPDYFERHQLRKNLLVLDAATGQEVKFDLDQDGAWDAAPMLWTGTHAGNAYPPLINNHDPQDNLVYMRSTNRSSGGIPGAMLVGWQFNTPLLNNPVSPMIGQSDDWPSDEPTGISGAGGKVFWNLCCDRFIAGADLTHPNSLDKFVNRTGNSERQQRYASAGGNPPINTSQVPAGYHSESTKFYRHPPEPAVYWAHGDNVGPTIYNQTLYVIRSNAVIAFAADGAGASAPIRDVATKTATVHPDPIHPNTIKQRLINEVTNLVNAGHLKPAYGRSGLLDTRVQSQLEEYMLDYWHNPADTFYVLTRALPHLPDNLGQSVKNYLKEEYKNFSPGQFTHIGWKTCCQRDAFIYPDNDPTETKNTFDGNFDKQASTNFSGWNLPPHNIYAMYLSAQAGLIDANSAFNEIKNKLGSVSDIGPHVENAYLAGYKGYIKLGELAGQNVQSQINTYNNLLASRINDWTDFPTPNSGNQFADKYFYTTLPAWNFMYLNPDTATDLSDKNFSKMNSTLDRYHRLSPYWMLALNGEIQGENAISPYQETHALFQAHALIAKTPYNDLVKYLDTPNVPIGDLYYIDNLIALLEADDVPVSSPPVGERPGDLDADEDTDILDQKLLNSNFRNQNCGNVADIDGSCTVDIFDYTLLVKDFGKSSSTTSP